MPNHVSNRISFKSKTDDWQAEEKAIEDLRTLMKTDDEPFDFNVLITYPEHFARLDNVRRQKEKEGVKWADLPKDGFNQGGYEWCVANWGTKWGAYDVGFDYGAILFNTAWNTPRPIWIEISKRFPALQLVIEYADEDRGRNCGILTYWNGKLVSIVTEEGLTDPVMFARAIIAEVSNADHYRELTEAKARIKELETQSAAVENSDAAPPGASVMGG